MLVKINSKKTVNAIFSFYAGPYSISTVVSKNWIAKFNRKVCSAPYHQLATSLFLISNLMIRHLHNSLPCVPCGRCLQRLGEGNRIKMKTPLGVRSLWNENLGCSSLIKPSFSTNSWSLSAFRIHSALLSSLMSKLSAILRPAVVYACAARFILIFCSTAMALEVELIHSWHYSLARTVTHWSLADDFNASLTKHLVRFIFVGQFWRFEFLVQRCFRSLERPLRTIEGNTWHTHLATRWHISAWRCSWLGFSFATLHRWNTAACTLVTAPLYKIDATQARWWRIRHTSKFVSSFVLFCSVRCAPIADH